MGKKRKFLDIDVKIEETVNSDKAKMVLEFNCQEAASTKSCAVKQSDHVNLTTRFLSGKILMFAKLSLMSFKYEMLKRFLSQIKRSGKFSKNIK